MSGFRWRSLGVLAAVYPSLGVAEPQPPDSGFVAVPSLERTSARARMTLGSSTLLAGESAEPVAIVSVRVAFRVTPWASITAGVIGEADDFGFWTDSSPRALHSATVGAPFVAAVARYDVRDDRSILVRAIAALSVKKERDSSLGVASSVLAHDPTITWAAAHAGTVQVALAGTDGGIRWTGAVAAVGLITDGMTIRPRSHVLLRADAGAEGWLHRCWSWEVEVGAISDTLDEDTDEGTDLVPVWNVGLRHHRGPLWLGFSSAGGWIGGARRSVLGPSVTFEIGGSL